MPRPRKYLKGPVIKSPLVAMSAILDGQYIIVNDKPQHPSWMGAQQLHQIAGAARRGSLHFAVPNPEHPDNKDTPR